MACFANLLPRVFPVLLFFYIFFFTVEPVQTRLKRAPGLPAFTCSAPLHDDLANGHDAEVLDTDHPAGMGLPQPQPYGWMRYIGQLFLPAAQAAMKHWGAAIDAANRSIAIDPRFQLARNNLTWLTEKRKLSH